MKISVDDWHFRPAEGEMLVLDAYLDNGQHAVIEVNPMKNAMITNGEIPEIIVFCELPGERVAETGCATRWIARPPSRECDWSNVQLPVALLEQIRDRLGAHATTSQM
jgi:hypothetical protein